MNLSYRLNSLDRHAIRIIAPPMISSMPIASPMKPDKMNQCKKMKFGDFSIFSTKKNAQEEMKR